MGELVGDWMVVGLFLGCFPQSAFLVPVPIQHAGKSTG